MKGLGMDVLCLGLVIADVLVKLKPGYTSFNDDLTVVKKITLSGGGNALNTALALSKLGMNTGVAGKVGCDYFGDFLINVMKGHGCDIRGIIRDPNVNTSVTVALVRPDGQRNFLHYSAASASLDLKDVDFHLISESKILHIGGTLLLPGLDGVPMANILRNAQERKVMTSLDVSWDPRGRWMQELEPCLRYVDIFLPNLEEGIRLTGKENPREVADVLLSYGIRIVGLKLGDKGCYLKTGNEEFTLPAIKIKTVDLTGAGDSFIAGFLTGISKGFSVEKSGMLANAVGAMCVASLGATQGVKTLEETLDFMNETDLFC
ncbi:MAG: carbohydrate kinase family protein [bacterium]